MIDMVYYDKIAKIDPCKLRYKVFIPENNHIHLGFEELNTSVTIEDFWTRRWAE